MDVRKVGLGGKEWINPAQDRDGSEFLPTWNLGSIEHATTR
jgi:hypothetical protein